MQRRFNIGDKVTWMTVNGPKVGAIERLQENGILVRLPSGKCIIANETSLHLWKEI